MRLGSESEEDWIQGGGCDGWKMEDGSTGEGVEKGRGKSAYDWA